MCSKGIIKKPASIGLTPISGFWNASENLAKGKEINSSLVLPTVIYSACIKNRSSPFRAIGC